MSVTFDDLLAQVAKCEMKTVAVAVAQDTPVLEAVKVAKERKIANAILESVGPITPGKDFAISERPDLYELNSTNSIAVYVEVEFHDNVTGAKWIINNSQKAGEAIAKGVCDYYKVKFI